MKRIATTKQLPYFVLVLLCTVLFSCKSKTGLHYETFQTNGGWGYNILVKKQILIHQETIPAEATMKGFETEAEAKAMADLVVKKMRHRQLPSVTAEEVAQIKNKASTAN